jgi:hypothetical protein
MVNKAAKWGTRASILVWLVGWSCFVLAAFISAKFLLTKFVLAAIARFLPRAFLPGCA